MVDVSGSMSAFQVSQCIIAHLPHCLHPPAVRSTVVRSMELAPSHDNNANVGLPQSDVEVALCLSSKHELPLGSCSSLILVQTTFISGVLLPRNISVILADAGTQVSYPWVEQRDY